MTEDEILSQMPEGRLWLAELRHQIDLNRTDFGRSFAELKAAQLVAQLKPEHQAALAAIFIQREVNRVLGTGSLRPSDARVVEP